MSTILVSQPATGEKQILALAANQMLELGFNTADVTVDRSENDLLFSFNDNSEIRVEDFFATGGTALPNFVLADGTEIASAELLSRLNGNMDIATAAGPAGADSGGLGAYASDAGTLVSGVDRLGQLDGIAWNREVDLAEASTPAALLLAQAEPVPPVDPVIPSEPEPDLNYHTRLIVTDSTQDQRFTFQAVDVAGNLVINPELIELVNTSELVYFTDFVINADGTISAQLTAAGLAALQQADGHAGDMLILRVDGVEYQMPLIVQDQQSYDYKEEENRAELDTALKAEWYNATGNLADESIRLGGTEYNTAAIHGTLTNSSLETNSNSIDTVTITCGDLDNMMFAADGSSSIDTGDGDDTITLTGSLSGYANIGSTAMSAASNGSNTIDSGAGNDTVTLSGNYAMYAVDGGVNTIDTGADNDNVTLSGKNYTMFTYNGSSNSIATGSGDDNVTITNNSGVYYLNTMEGNNSIDTGTGNDTVTLSSLGTSHTVIASRSGSHNRIDTGADKDTVQITSEDGNALYATSRDTSNTINTGAENDTVLISSKGGNALHGNSAGINSIITEGGDDRVTIDSIGGSALYSSGGATNNGLVVGSNIIDTGIGNDTVELSSVNNHAMNSSTQISSNRIITGEGTDSVTLSSINGSAMAGGGLGKSGYGNYIDTGTGKDDTVTLSSENSAAMSVDGQGTNKVTTEGTVTLNGNMHAQYTANSSMACENLIEADKVVLNGDMFAHTGTYAKTLNSIEASEVALNGGMRAQNDASTGDTIETINIIAAADDAGQGLNLTINGDYIYNNEDIDAMWVSGKGALNRIEGNDQADIIDIHGNIQAYSGGVNEIVTGGGADEISIEGFIYESNGGQNRIDSGSGDDEIYINGSFGLEIDGGEGNDTLTLYLPENRGNYLFTDFLQEANSISNVETLILDLINSGGDGMDDLDLGYLFENGCIDESVKELYVKNISSDDTINMGNAILQGTSEEDGVTTSTYTYTNEADQTLTIYLQTSVM